MQYFTQPATRVPSTIFYGAPRFLVFRTFWGVPRRGQDCDRVRNGVVDLAIGFHFVSPSSDGLGGGSPHEWDSSGWDVFTPSRVGGFSVDTYGESSREEVHR